MQGQLATRNTQTHTSHKEHTDTHWSHTGHMEPTDTHWLHTHFALVHLDVIVGVCLPGQLLQLICCVLTGLQVRLYNVLGDTIYGGRWGADTDHNSSKTVAYHSLSMEHETDEPYTRLMKTSEGFSPHATFYVVSSTSLGTKFIFMYLNLNCRKELLG